jgi:hypothetical protein
MRKILLAAFLLVLFLNVHSQKNYSLTASANFSFLTNGLANNDAGIGLSVRGNAFAKKRLQLRTDASLDHFIGDKSCLLNPSGGCYTSNPTIFNLATGPEFFIRRVSIAALYGYVTYKFFDFRVHSGNLKLALAVRPPKHNKMSIGANFTTLTGKYSDVHFWGVSVGFKIL